MCVIFFFFVFYNLKLLVFSFEGFQKKKKMTHLRPNKANDDFSNQEEPEREEEYLEYLVVDWEETPWLALGFTESEWNNPPSMLSQQQYNRFTHLMGDDSADNENNDNVVSTVRGPLIAIAATLVVASLSYQFVRYTCSVRHGGVSGVASTLVADVASVM